MTNRTTSGEQRRSELSELRRELRDKQSYLSDGSDDLWRDISRWLLESYNAPVGSLRSMVLSTLAELQSDHQHRMYDHPNVDHGTDAFPDSCKGCPHYGVQCPVLARHHSKQTFQRIFDQAEDDDALQGKLAAFSAKHHCHVLQETLSEWEEGYAQFLSQGEQLRTLLNADIKGIDISPDDLNPETWSEPTTEASEKPSTSEFPIADAVGVPPDDDDVGMVDETMPEDVAQRVANISDSLMAEDGEETEA